MKTFKNILYIILAGLLFSCSGDVTTPAANNASAPAGIDRARSGVIKYSKLEGSNIAISNENYDQQNPFTIYLPDKNLYFVVWEDWRNQNTTGSDIYGQFIKVDGTFCSSEFAISNSSGNQTVPKATYRNGAGLTDTTDRIIVVWQDTRGTTSNGYIYYTSLTNFPDYSNCTNYTASSATSGTQIGFNTIKKWDLTKTTQENSSSQLIALGDGTTKTFSTSLTAPVKAGSVSVSATVGSQSITFTDNGIGTLNPNTGSHYGTIAYTSGALAITFATAPDNNTQVKVTAYTYYTYTYSTTSVSISDTLSSRKAPRVSYDAVRDRFWIVWIESRSILNKVSERCFPYGGNYLYVANEGFGDTSFPAYVMLDGSSLAELQNKINVTGADIIRNGEIRTNRLITSTIGALTEVHEYEFFKNVNNINVANDTNSPESFMVWEGIRQKGTLTCTCTDKNSNSTCDSADVIAHSFTTSDYEDGLVHIYGLFDKEIDTGSIYSEKLDTSTSSAYYPSIAFDPITGKFLVAWEDTKDGANTKIYGQLVYSGGGLYNQNFIISYQDTDGDGKQDTNVANSKQTKPFISYDTINQRYFVIWQDGRNGTVSLENLDVYGQYLDSEGSLRGSNYSISVAEANQYNPTIAYNSENNQFFAVWKDARNYTTKDSDIYGQRFSPGQPQITLLNLDNISFSPPLLDFGSVIVKQFSTMSFKVKNTGDIKLKIDCFSSLASPFSHESLATELQSCEGTYASGSYLEIVPSAELTFTTRFESTSEGTFTSSFIIQSDGENKTVNLQGIGVQADITVSTSTLAFGNVTVGQSSDLPLTITNNGIVSYNITNITGVSAPFSIETSVTYPYTMAAGQSLNLTVRFTPTQVTGSSGQMNIQTDISGLSATVSLSGTGKGTPVLSVTPSSLNFSSVTVNSTSDKSVTLSNTGTDTLTVSSISITGTGFELVSSISTPLSIAVNATQTVSVRFSPTSATSYSGTLSIQSDGGNTSVSLVGQGVSSSTGGGVSTGGGGEPPSSSGGGKSGCFIATAAYGSYLDPNVVFLRGFRDKYLITNDTGKLFVNFYYRTSPSIANFISEYKTLRLLTRLALTPIIYGIKYPSAFIFIIGIGFLVIRMRNIKKLLS